MTELGDLVTFLREADAAGRGGELWAFEVATGTQRRVYTADGALHDYSLAGATAALVDGGALVVAGLRGGGSRTFPTPGPVRQPRPDPSGRRVAYLTHGALYVLDRASGEVALLAGEAENPAVAWGVAEHAARSQFGRHRGYWWAPDGNAVLAARVDASRLRASDPAAPYPRAGEPTEEVSLHVLDLDGGWVDVHWDRETYPYLASVSWSEVGGPLITVLRRLQQHGLVLAVDPRTGETQVHAELADPRWVRPVPGSPRYLPDGRVLVGGELAHDGYDARCLFADGGLLTPPNLYIRRVCGRLGPDLLVEASEGEPSEQHLYRVAIRPASASAEVARLTAGAGWHTGECGGETVAIGTRSLDRDGTEWMIVTGGTTVGGLRSATVPGRRAPRPMLDRVTDRRLPAGVLYPPGHAGGRLPVLVDSSGGPGWQAVRAAREAWLDRQWWAEHGFAVVVVDGRGTPGVAPSFEKVVHRRLADVMLADQVDALAALAEKHPDLDLGRVAMRGYGFAGWLAVMAALSRPEAYRCAVAIDPIVAWERGVPGAFAERLLGMAGDASEVYQHNSLLDAAAEPPRPDEARAVLLASTTPEPAPEVMQLAELMRGTARPVVLATGPAPATEQLEFLRQQLGVGQ